jgi:Homeodomain-like domain/DDE superfamily endonuclease
MAQDLCVIVGAEDRARLASIVDDRNRPLKHIQRAQIILFSADRLPVLQVARGAGVSRPVWRWQRRYAEVGVEGLLRDKTRPPGRQPVPTATVARVLALTQGEPPGEATHWTGRAMAKAVGLSLRTVQRIWEAHRLQPHRIRTFKRSNDPAFAEKVEDVVGLYMHPPAHAVMLSIDEKSQIQALDRTQPGLPIKPGRCGTMTHDYKRHGTTTLFAALNTLDGIILGRCMQRHRHQEFIRFLNAVERAVPAGKLVHAIVDNYATHTHPKSLPPRRRGSKPGSPGTRAGASTSPRNPVPGSTPSKASSPNSPASASSAASSDPSSTCRPPSTAISTSTTMTPSPSCGPNPPMPSSPSSAACLYLLFESVH